MCLKNKIKDFFTPKTFGNAVRTIGIIFILGIIALFCIGFYFGYRINDPFDILFQALVAFGTILMAIAIVYQINVSQDATAETLKEMQDQRKVMENQIVEMKEQRKPILTLRYHPKDALHWQIFIKNVGLGPAEDVKVESKAIVAVKNPMASETYKISVTPSDGVSFPLGIGEVYVISFPDFEKILQEDLRKNPDDMQVYAKVKIQITGQDPQYRKATIKYNKKGIYPLMGQSYKITKEEYEAPFEQLK